MFLVEGGTYPDDLLSQVRGGYHRHWPRVVMVAMRAPVTSSRRMFISAQEGMTTTAASGTSW